MPQTDLSAPQVFEREVFAVTMTRGNTPKAPTLLNLCTKREYAKEFIADAFPEFKPMPSFHANANGELGTVYYHQGVNIHIQKTLVGFGIYQWLLGSEHYQSSIAKVMV